MLQVVADPPWVRVAQASAGQLSQAPCMPVGMPLSHVSPANGVTTPSPQRAGQSVSLEMFAPMGQQPSLVVPEGVVIGVWVHTAVQVAAEPEIASVVQALLSLQSVAALTGQRQVWLLLGPHV